MVLALPTVPAAQRAELVLLSPFSSQTQIPGERRPGQGSAESIACDALRAT
jgi:hypothetical protein